MGCSDICVVFKNKVDSEHFKHRFPNLSTFSEEEWLGHSCCGRRYDIIFVDRKCNQHWLNEIVIPLHILSYYYFN